MLNVNFGDEELASLQADGYYIEEKKDVITIRDIQGKTIGEMVRLKYNNTIILMSQTECIWCKTIIGIETWLGHLYVHVITTGGVVAQIKLP
ncbi:MAG: hypothetical protein IJE05_06360 [Clostridia bacterium]|nr:hypothetical protein [Clostridia bacterium]